MIELQSFTFNDFQENTYLLFDESKECIIIDPGCQHGYERKELQEFIGLNELKPVKLINTHCHIDHVLGNAFVADLYNIPLYMHRDELKTYQESMGWALGFGIKPEEIPAERVYIDEGDKISFGNSELEILFTPGHSVASLSFLCKEQHFIVSGDVLFLESIGRTDLPGGNFETLIKSIRNKLLTLQEDTIVYPGHGPATTIGYERDNNPFLR